MNRVPFRDVMEAVLAQCGQKFDATLNDQQSILATYINIRMSEAWNFGPWHDIALIEERAFADSWNTDVDYVIGDIVYLADTGKYYSAKADNSGKSPDTNTTEWLADCEHETTISHEQYGAEKINRVWKITSQNPRKFKTFRSYEFDQSGTDIHVPECGLTTVWLHFSPPAPRFTGKKWDAALASTYTRGTIIFYPGEESGTFPNTGECYRADLDSEGNAIWVLIPFPEFLQRFVVSAAAADMLRYYGKSEEATELRNESYAALYEEARKNDIGAQVTISGR